MAVDNILRSIDGKDLGIDSSGNLLLLTGGAMHTTTSTASISLTPAAGSANVCLVTIQLKDYAGNALSAVRNLDVWLSDAASGAGLTATTASGAVAAGASGADIGTYTTKKALRVQTNASGVYILSITDTSKTLFKVCAQVGNSAPVIVTLITANYG